MTRAQRASLQHLTKEERRERRRLLAITRGKIWRASHPERVRLNNLAYKEKNGEQIKKRKQAYYLEHLPSIRIQTAQRYRNNREQALIERRARRSGFTQFLWELAWKIQNGRCAICSCDFALLPRSTDGRTRVYADHDHKTKRPRGLLCSKCNSAIGLLFDSPHSCRRAALYLSHPPLELIV